MALSPREFPRFFPDTLPPSTAQRFQGSLEFRNLSLGMTKFPTLPQLDTSTFQDHNIAFLLQQWLLNSLRVTPPLLPTTTDIRAPSFPPNAAVMQSITQPNTPDFILQDLHKKYKTFLADYEATLQRKVVPSTLPNDFLHFSTKLNTSPFPLPQSPFRYFNNPFPLPFPCPKFEKYPKPIISQLPSQFYSLPSRNTSPQIESTPKTTIHHQSDDVKREMTSRDTSQTADSLKDKKTHKCMYCGKLYSRKYGLKIHIRTHTGYKPLKCKVCGRPFGDPSNLNKHVRLHAEGDTPYRCEFCGKVLVRRRDLERHIKSRHPNAACKADMFAI